MVSEDKRIVILYVYDILKKYTDEKHSLTYSEIGEKLQQEYNVNPDPKTISRIVGSLTNYGCDIIKRGNNGCALLGRKIDNSELSFLIDAVLSSKSISFPHAKSLMESLLADCSIYEKKKYEYIYKASDVARTNSKVSFYTIDTISRAIEENKQISFTYNEISINKKLKARFDGKEFLINPYFLINNRGKYYLVCNYDKYNTLSNYKIECISNIKILETPIKPMEQLEDAENFNISDYINEHIYMFSGKTIPATIKIANPKVINDIVDWYGENIAIKEKDDGIYIEFKVNEQAFLYWALQYGLNIEIIKPVAPRKKYISMLNEIMNKYKGENKWSQDN